MDPTTLWLSNVSSARWWGPPLIWRILTITLMGWRIPSWDFLWTYHLSDCCSHLRVLHHTISRSRIRAPFDFWYTGNYYVGVGSAFFFFFWAVVFCSLIAYWWFINSHSYLLAISSTFRKIFYRSKDQRNITSVTWSYLAEQQSKLFQDVRAQWWKTVII
jgi:hypothetical protein